MRMACLIRNPAGHHLGYYGFFYIYITPLNIRPVNTQSCSHHDLCKWQCDIYIHISKINSKKKITVKKGFLWKRRVETYIVPQSVSFIINDMIINVLFHLFVICNINYVLIIPLSLVTQKDAVMIFSLSHKYFITYLVI